MYPPRGRQAIDRSASSNPRRSVPLKFPRSFLNSRPLLNSAATHIRARLHEMRDPSHEPLPAARVVGGNEALPSRCLTRLEVAMAWTGVVVVEPSLDVERKMGREDANPRLRILRPGGTNARHITRQSYVFGFRYP